MIEMYFLMHKDIKLAAFTVDGDDILSVKHNTDETAHKSGRQTARGRLPNFL